MRANTTRRGALGRLALIAAVSIAGCAPLLLHTLAASAASPRYYLSLGDSLAQGVQPNSSGASVPTAQGYADDLFATYASTTPGLQLVKLGCPGETTTTMIGGGICSYAQGSQLAAATAFLQAHRGDTALVTLDIGANDVDGCAAGGSIDLTCVAGGLAEAARDLPVILGALRNAAGDVPVVAMNLYDPFLAAWLSGEAGQAAAVESVGLALTFNGILDTEFAAFRVPVADVQDAFDTAALVPLVPLGTALVPLDVARICQWTWMCAPPPVGPNTHANAAGYQVIAGAFERVIGPALPG